MYLNHFALVECPYVPWVNSKYFCIFLNIRTSQIRKVPSFGAAMQPINRREVNSSSSATKSEGTQTDMESNRPTAVEADNRPDEANEDGGDINRQDQSTQVADEQEKEEEEEEQSALTMTMNEDVEIIENYVDGEPSYQVRLER